MVSDVVKEALKAKELFVSPRRRRLPWCGKWTPWTKPWLRRASTATRWNFVLEVKMLGFFVCLACGFVLSQDRCVTMATARSQPCVLPRSHKKSVPDHIGFYYFQRFS